METVEVIVYMTIAVILGALIIAFIGGWNVAGTYDAFTHFFRGQDTSYEKITSDQLPRAVLATWEACGLGSTSLNKTVYVTDAAPLNKSFIFTYIREANLCRSLQSQQASCGEREDVTFSSTQGPAVLQLRCDAATNKLIIS